ncbi:MAG: hypothetical protein ACFFG0_03825 [Candidatus Thorarchaeota archaeon]
MNKKILPKKGIESWVLYNPYSNLEYYLDKDCGGCSIRCFIYNVYSKFEVNNKKHICPCIKCIVKAMCSVECDKFIKFDRIRWDPKLQNKIEYYYRIDD